MAALFAAGLTVLCNILPDMAEVRQGVQTVIDFKDNITASAAVTAVGTACRNKEFAAKAHMTVAALAGLNINFGVICKHPISCIQLKHKRASYLAV